MWCVLELNLSIVGGSMPAMKPVLQKYFPRLLASTQGASDSGNYYMDDTRSKPKRSRITDPYNISRDRDSKSDSESERRIIAESEEITTAGDKASEAAAGVMGASYNNKKSWSETITKTVEYGYEVDNEISSLPGGGGHHHTSKLDEEAQMVRARTPPRM